MKDNVYILARHITVLGTGDMQTGFCRNGINFKASKDALIILRGFFTFKGYSFKRSFLYRLRVDKRIEQKKQAMLAPATCYHDKWLKQRIMASLHHVSRLVSFRRLIVERGNKSTLTPHMGDDCISWGKVQ